MYAATMIVGSLGGYLSAHGLQRLGFLICALATLVTLILALFMVREEPVRAHRAGLQETLGELRSALTQPGVLGVGAFLFLWSFNPFSTSVLYLYMTDELGLGEQFYGHTVSLMSAAMMAASLSYGFYCRRVRFHLLVHASIVLGVISTIAYWAMVDRWSAAWISVLIGFTYMSANLIQFDFAARVCPPRAAATVFALLMALTNIAMSLSTLAGGYLYDYASHWWGATVSFRVLVLVGALTTAACWLLMPLLAGPARQSPGT
jgi:predicted MFS family arabinose efflux permease